MGVVIDSTSKTELLKRIGFYLDSNKKFFIVTPNPEILLAARKDASLKEALNSADISIPDGTGILFAAKILKLRIKHRIQGRIFMSELLKIVEERHGRVYLLGSSNAVIHKTIDTLRQRYPSVLFNGSGGPKLGHDANPVDKAEFAIEKETISQININSPDILFIGFGAPKQEKWFYKNRKNLQVGGAMVIGGAFDVLSGYKKSPPDIFVQFGLEWLWRLIQEPNRIIRILRATVLFTLSIFREKYR